MTVHLVAGLGEVGSAIYEVLRDGGFETQGVDSAKRIFPVPIGTAMPDGYVLHVCFPYDQFFIEQVMALAGGASLVIVHSTVRPGTCDPNGWIHSPVQGQHPNLASGVRTFVKWFGGRHAAEAADIFEACGVSTRVFGRALTTEVAKVFDTTRYGWEIVWAKESARICTELGVAPVILKLWTRDYNNGYKALDKGYLRRSILTATPGPIGGHCVIPNLSLIQDRLLDLIRSFNYGYQEGC